MQLKKLALGLAALVLVALGVNPDQAQKLVALFDSGAQTQGQVTAPAVASSAVSGSKWSDTSPAINLHHVFDGEINRSGKPTGYHARPGGSDPGSARVMSVRDGPNRHGVYTATIAVRDGTQWKEKFSSFFPDELSRQEVVSVILHAFEHSENPRAQPWRGPSGRGFDVQGYTLRDGDINTAFPVYQQ
ncbi:MAG: EndoU domain-containing protein [Pseudomonadota bacterium]